jgi:signal transduction histidine kinase
MGRSDWKLKYLDRNVFFAILLGIAAVLTNAISYQLLPGENLPAGHLFLFWSAATLGPYASLVTGAIGALPECLSHNDYLNATRLLLLCYVTAYVAAKSPRVPMFITTAILWAVLFAPALYLVGDQNAPPWQSWNAVAALCLKELLLAMIGGALLLNSSLRTILSRRARHVSVLDMLLHIIPLAAILGICAALAVNQEHFTLSGTSFTAHSGHVFILILMSLAAATAVALYLSRLLEQNMQQLLSHSMLHAGQSQSFSGLSSDYWRRRSSTNLPRSETFGRTATNPPSQEQWRSSKPGLLLPEQGICAINKSGAIAYLNQKFRKLTELRDNDPLGKRLNAVGMNPNLEQAMVVLLEKTFAKGPRTVEVKLNKIPNKLRFIEITSQYAGSFQGSSFAAEPESIILMVRDITDRRAVEYHLLKGQRMGSLSNLVKGLAHAFNNSLATIIGQASAAQYTLDTIDVKEPLDRIVQSARHASVLVRQLLDFADGRLTQTKKGNLGDLVEQHLELLKKLVGEQIEIGYQPPSQMIGASYEPNLILQVLTNLIVNAKEAIGDNPGKISLALSTEELDEEIADISVGARAGSFARLSITDTGCGMNPEILSRAFEPLYTTKSGNGNPGLGLSVVFGIIRSLDGFLSMESQMGRGTTVSIYLPLASISQSLSVPDSAQRY